jgi:hypothetical protein
MPETAFQGWAILELFGHRQVPGMVDESQVAGARFLRVRVPDLKRDETGRVTGVDLERVRLEQLYAPAAVYALTPTTEETIARLLAREAAYLPLLPPPGSPPMPEEEDFPDGLPLTPEDAGEEVGRG